MKEAGEERGGYDKRAKNPCRRLDGVLLRTVFFRHIFAGRSVGRGIPSLHARRRHEGNDGGDSREKKSEPWKNSHQFNWECITSSSEVGKGEFLRTVVKIFIGT